MRLLTFNQILPKIDEILQDASLLPILNKLKELTVIRDVYGKIHLYIKVGNITLTSEERKQFHQVFERELGNYYTNDLWESNEKKVQDVGLINVIERERVNYSFGVSNLNTYLLERHQAKHIWTLQNTATPLWNSERIIQGHKPAIISFFSFKGGAGRTTSLIGTALSLAKAGKRVAIVDLDLEAPGLSSIFFKEDEIYTGVVDYLIEKQIHENRWNTNQHILPIDASILNEQSDNLKIFPAGIVDTDFIQKLARLDFQNLTTNKIGEKLHTMLDEIAKLNRGLDFILLDARAGFHDIGGFALSDLSHAAVIVGQHTKQTWAGLSYVIKRLAKPSNEINERLPLVLVHSMAPTDTEADFTIQQQFKEKAYDVFLNNYYSEDEEVPNSNNEDEPFHPFIIPWEQLLRGDLTFSFMGNQPTPFENARNQRLLTHLTSEPYFQLAERLCDLFEKTLTRE